MEPFQVSILIHELILCSFIIFQVAGLLCLLNSLSISVVLHNCNPESKEQNILQTPIADSCIEYKNIDNVIHLNLKNVCERQFWDKDFRYQL